MTQPCIMNSTACEYFTHGSGLYAGCCGKRIAKASVSLIKQPPNTGKAIAPFLPRIESAGVS